MPLKNELFLLLDQVVVFLLSRFTRCPKHFLLPKVSKSTVVALHEFLKQS